MKYLTTIFAFLLLLLLGLVPQVVRAEGDEPAPPDGAADGVVSDPEPEEFVTLDSPVATVSEAPDDDHTEMPEKPKDSRARRFFSETYQKLGDIISGRNDIVFFASMSVIQGRLVYDDEVPNEIDPNAGRPLRPVASSSVIYGQLNLGYRIEQWVSWAGSVGAFVEADITDLRRETDHGRFGAGLYIAGPKGFRILTYINPTLAVGYRHQADRCLQDQGAGFTPVNCEDIDWNNVTYQTIRNEVAASDITNFFVSINVAIPIDCLFDPDACEKNTR